MEKVNITLEAMPQYVVRLEEKVDVLTEIVTKLSENFSKPTTHTAETFIGTDEACKVLELSTSRIYALVQKGELPFYKPGKRLKFLKSELLEWLKKSGRKGIPSIEEQMEGMTKGMRNSAKGRWAR